MEDGMIKPGQAPESWVFTPERFSEGSYLWKTGDRIIVSFIEAVERGKGHFSALVKAIEADGLKVHVPTPLGRMQEIIGGWGFTPKDVFDPEMGMVKVWTR